MQTIVDDQSYEIASRDLKVNFTFKTGDRWGNLMSINKCCKVNSFLPPTSALRKDVPREVGHGEAHGGRNVFIDFEPTNILRL